jgi:hypothetical protein
MRSTILLAFALSLHSGATAADWGNLKMRLVYDGEPPPPKTINAGEAGAIPDESLLINEQDRGIKNVCVWLLYGGDDPRPVHPDYEKTATSKVTMKIAAGSFVPRIRLVRTTQTLVISNEDIVGHNVKADFFNNGAFNVLLKTGDSLERKFEYPEHPPVNLSGSIQPWLGGYVLIDNNPYAATSDEHGQLPLANLPAGRWTFVFWHEKSGYLKKAIYNEGKYELSRGQTTLTIKPGDNDLGEIKLPPEQFKK